MYNVLSKSFAFILYNKWEQNESENGQMDIKRIGKMPGGQDGAIFGNTIFRFGSRGGGSVYDASPLNDKGECEIAPIASLTLDGAEIGVPHSNAVVFGTEYYAEGDEFPLLYSNVYNNYAKADGDKRPGELLVYRIMRTDGGFTSKLLQVIKVGFAGVRGLWLSEGEVNDARPYGNFVIDKERSLLYAFVMRDGDKTTRYFSFRLPKLSEGVCDGATGVKTVMLGEEDIVDKFDAPYHKFIQGACMRDGIIYSTEGFGKNIHPGIRVIDTVKKEQIFYLDLFEAGYENEAEFIDFLGDKCIYSDAKGNLFELSL